MATCTDAERELLDAIMNDRSADVISQAEAKVLNERIDPKLTEAAVKAFVAVREAVAARDKAWGALEAAGVKGKDQVTSVWSAIERESNRRLEADSKGAR